MTTERQGRESPVYNSTFAIGGVSCSADSFVVAESSVLRINICGKNPTHRKSAKRSKIVKMSSRRNNYIKQLAYLLPTDVYEQ